MERENKRASSFISVTIDIPAKIYPRQEILPDHSNHLTIDYTGLQTDPHQDTKQILE